MTHIAFHFNVLLPALTFFPRSVLSAITSEKFAQHSLHCGKSIDDFESRFLLIQITLRPTVSKHTTKTAHNFSKHSNLLTEPMLLQKVSLKRKRFGKVVEINHLRKTATAYGIRET